MNTTLITLLFAFVLILLCVIGMAIGKILTGKNKLSCKRCGNPEQKDKKKCDICTNTTCKKKR